VKLLQELTVGFNKLVNPVIWKIKVDFEFQLLKALGVKQSSEDAAKASVERRVIVNEDGH
jgi:hypothetical protein